jgi:hypothetical protein
MNNAKLKMREKESNRCCDLDFDLLPVISYFV